VKLSWTTASEVNNDFFTVERSKDLSEFEELLTVKGAGNSNRLLNYTATDTNPYQGISYYRLKQTDFNGNYKYSDIVDVDFKDELTFNVFPNPSDGTTLYVQFTEEVKSEEVTVSIFNINAKLCFYSNLFVTGTLENNTLVLNLKERLAPGLYIVKASAGQLSNKLELVVR
jgi:hypothetical protein